jgi:hypothetical protein
MESECKISQIDAFKIFAIDETGQLQSSFIPSFKEELKYPPNQKSELTRKMLHFLLLKILKMLFM